MSPMSFGVWDQIRDHADEYQRRVADVPLAEHRRMRDDLIKHLRRDPLVVRYVQHSRSARNTNVEPWQAIGEQYYAAMLMLATSLGDPAVSLVHPFREDQEREVLQYTVGLAIGMLMAVPYLWTDTVNDLVAASPPLPKHVVSRAGLLPYPSVFFSFESARVINTETLPSFLARFPEEGHLESMVEEFGGHIDTNWMYLIDCGDRIRGYCDFQHGERIIIEGSEFVYGQEFPTSYRGLEHAGVERLLKQFAFINSPYVTTREERLPRPIRREIERERRRSGRDVSDPDAVCHVVELRRVQDDREAPTANPLEVARAWKHHWWVSGHYRAQWRPSTRDHKVIWIAPHVKGPLDKPLLDKVYAVDR